MKIKIENWKLLVLSVFYVIIAILSHMIKDEQLNSFFMISGIIIALIGVFQIVSYFFKKDYLKSDEFSFSFGMVYLIAGIIVCFKQEVIVNNYPIVLSAVVVLDSIVRLQYVLNMIRLDEGNWKLHGILSIVPLVYGILLILIPMDYQTLKYFFSALLIIDAIANFITIFSYTRVMRDHVLLGEDYVDTNALSTVDDD